MLCKYFPPNLTHVTALLCETHMFSIVTLCWNVLFATNCSVSHLTQSWLLADTPWKSYAAALHSAAVINHTRALRHIRPLLTLDVAKMIGHSIVSSRLDYANALLHGTSVCNINRLHVAQNSLVRTVCQAPRSASATELRRQLHWLPIRQRISYKVAVIS